jgi:tetratricopeptide (TPR) repeat protein
VALAGVLTGSGTGCDLINQFMKADPEVVRPAQDKLEDGDLPGAAAEYEELAAAHPDSVHVAIGHAYMQMLSGDYDGADSTLASVEEGAGEQLGEIKLRRALVALQKKDLDSVKAHGTASGLSQGRLLAAEVHLVDLESDEATEILQDVAEAGGPVGNVAQTYLDMLNSDDQIRAGLAEASALWALGDRSSACEAAEELVQALDGDDAEKNAQLLLWAGRAVTSGQPAVATTLVDSIDFPPDGQAWRVQATRAMIAAAEGDTDSALRIFAQLREAGAPADGLADARATACALTDDKAAAKELVADLESAAAARCLLHVGAGRAALQQAPQGALRTYLENR